MQERNPSEEPAQNDSNGKIGTDITKDVKTERLWNMLRLL